MNNLTKAIIFAIFLTTQLWADDDEIPCVSNANNGPNDPTMIISTPEDLNRMRSNPKGSFRLANDIDLKGNQENQWEPIDFYGTFDGGGHVIRGIFISRVDRRDFQGFFGNIDEGSVVKNLGVYVDIKPYNGVHIGGLAGTLLGRIENCYAVGSVSGGAEVGGLVGRIGSGTGSIINSYASVNVNGSNLAVGGLVGNNIGGNIENCFATGSVSNGSAAGGGGLVGTNQGSIKNSYASGGGTFVTTNVGTICPNSGARTAADMKKRATFNAWDFDNIWAIQEGISYPFFWKGRFFPYMPEEFTYTGNPITVPLRYVGQDIDRVLERNVDYTASYSNNVNVGTAKIEVTFLRDYAYLGTRTFSFRINPKYVGVTWRNTVLRWHGAAQTPTPISSDENYPVKVIAPDNAVEIGNYVARAGLITPNSNIVLTCAEIEFSIIRRSHEVQWENYGPFVFNRMSQAPRAVVEIDRGNGDIFRPALIVTGSHRDVGIYDDQLAAMVMIRDEDVRDNIRLTNNTRDFEIIRRPLNIIMEDNNGNRADTLFADHSQIPTESALIEHISERIGFYGFARDTITNITDDERVLTGSPRIRITDVREIERTERSAELVRYRMYLLTIETGEINSQNYSLSDREVSVYVTNDGIEIITPIRNQTTRDTRHGIFLENAIASDTAKISVITPEPAQITLKILDNLGNTVHTVETQCLRLQSATPCEIVWNLTNTAGRFVANGTYLVIAEAKGANGKIYRYSARIGVNR